MRTKIHGTCQWRWNYSDDDEIHLINNGNNRDTIVLTINIAIDDYDCRGNDGVYDQYGVGKEDGSASGGKI